MHSPEVLQSIYIEHGRSVPRLLETLIGLDVPPDDVGLLGQLPWRYPANRIAVERERLGLLAVHPLLHWKLPPPPLDWLTPAICQKIFELALSYVEDEAETETPDQADLILPA